jgi:hypothetical protein
VVARGTLEQDLVGLIFDIKAMQDTLLELEIDVNKMPLGKLSKRNIQQGVRSPCCPLTYRPFPLADACVVGRVVSLVVCGTCAVV